MRIDGGDDGFVKSWGGRSEAGHCCRHWLTVTSECTHQQAASKWKQPQQLDSLKRMPGAERQNQLDGILAAGTGNGVLGLTS